MDLSLCLWCWTEFVYQQIQFMYTLSCCWRINTFLSATEILTYILLIPELLSPLHWLLDVVNCIRTKLPFASDVSTSANKLGSFDFTPHSPQPTMLEPINSFVFSASHFWFIYSRLGFSFFLSYGKMFYDRNSVGRIRIKRQTKYIALNELLVHWLLETFEMIQMENN